VWFVNFIFCVCHLLGIIKFTSKKMTAGQAKKEKGKKMADAKSKEEVSLVL
jgi:hypothetical protein